MTREKGMPPKVEGKPKTQTKGFYDKNKIVTAERVKEIDKELSELLGRLGDDDHITPGHPAKSSSGNKR